MKPSGTNHILVVSYTCDDSSNHFRVYDIRLIRIFPPLVDALMRSLGKFGSSLDFAHDSSGITSKITGSRQVIFHSITTGFATPVQFLVSADCGKNVQKPAV